MFSLSTCAVALILAGTYFFAYKFFKENFYFFIFVSWVANAAYLILDLNGPSFCDPNYFRYKIWISLLSVTSSGFLLFSLFSHAERKPSRSTWMGIVAAAIILAGITYVGITQLPKRVEIIPQLEYQREQGRPDIAPGRCDIAGVFPNEEHITLAKWVLPSTAVSFFLLWAIGAALNARLTKENAGWKGRTLSGTFYLYAILQFSYPFTPYLITQGSNWVLPFFLIAQVVKVGNAISIVGVLQSAIAYETLKRENEMQLKEAYLVAEEEKLQSKRHFIELGMLASSIKHDVNTPLTTMSFTIGTLKSKYQHDAQIIKKLEALEESMERIYAIVKVVDIFRGDKVFFDRDKFMVKTSMLEIAHRALKLLKNEREELKLPDSKYTIKVTGRDVWARVYPPMMEQVLVNIIKNGLEAIDEAGRKSGLITINVNTTEIAGSAYRRWVKVEVEDNGCGIPEENLNKLTTLFTTRSDKKPNSGIGLFIGRKILAIHAGKIKFESKVGEGTKVTVLLPEWDAIQKVRQQAAESDPETTDDQSFDWDDPLVEEPETEAARPEAIQTSES